MPVHGEHQKQLDTLNAIGEALNSAAEFEESLPVALERLIELTGLTTAWVFLSHTSEGSGHRGTFGLAACHDVPPALAHDDRQPLTQGGCECQTLLRKGRLDKGVNMVTCSRLAEAHGDKRGLELHASIPLLGSHGPLGILNLAAPGTARFDSERLAFLTAVGRQLGIALERHRLQAQRNREARYTAVLEERERLARCLHDSLSQLLFAAELSLESLMAEETAERSAAIANAAEAVRAALAELHGMVEVQRPPDLSTGLLPALERLATRAGSATLRIHFDSLPLELNGPAAEALYRIAQEAVANATRHSGARNTWIRLERHGRRVRLEVTDDGSGFDVAAAGGGMGLTGMRERAAAAGGELQVLSGSSGTTVLAEVQWQSG